MTSYSPNNTATRGEVILSQPAMRRLARLQARAEGANAAAQAALQAAQAAQMALQQAVTEECQDEGLAIPMGGQAQADIDWRSGTVRLREAQHQQSAEPQY